MGAFDLVKVCDNTVTGIWFRVVAVLQEGVSESLSTAAVHIFFENVFVTVTSQNEIWVRTKTLLFTHPLCVEFV